MLTGGDFNLNSVQRYTNSLNEGLKQTMLNHDTIFRKQVLELHRLYGIQKAMMEDLSWKEFNRYTSWTTNTEPIPIPFQDPPKYKLRVEEKAFSTLSMVDLTQTTNWDQFEDSQGTNSKLQRRPLDLQLPADDYISHVGTELPKKRDLLASHKESMEVKNFLRGNYFSDPDEVKLGLSTGEDTSKKRGDMRTCNKQTCLSTPYVIDLEESPEKASNEVAKPVSSFNFKAPTTFVENKHGIQIHVLSDPSFLGTTTKDPGHRLFMNCSLNDYSESFQERKYFNLDARLNECNGSSSFVNPFTQKQQSISYSTTHTDFNRIQLDESCCFLNDPAITIPSAEASSSGVLQGLAYESHKGTHTTATWWRQSNNCCSNETSDMPQQDNAAHSTLTDSGEKDSSTQASVRSTKFNVKSGSEVGHIDLETVPEDPLELCEDFGNQGIKRSEENVDLPLGLQNDVLHDDSQINNSIVTPSSKRVNNHLYTSLGGTDFPQRAGDAEIGQVSCEKSEEDTVSSSPYQSHIVVQPGCCKEFPAASKFDCVTDNNSSNIKDLRSGKEDKHKLEDSNFSTSEESGTTQLGSQIKETHSCEQDSIAKTGIYACIQEKSCYHFKAKHHDRDEQHKEATEVDDLVRGAAESLFLISLENSICSQDWFSKAESEELANKQKSEQPQYSSDSYESIVLRIPESSVVDYSVTSGPTELMETENNGCGMKLRRGRRLKDFQKDVLPGLVSLSRHEICEDIHSIGGVIKSNDSRKNRSRKASGENWCVPVRSRRSRLNYVGRRNYS